MSVTSNGHAVSVHAVADPTEFQRLAVDWNRLAEATDRSSVFLRHEWHRAAWAWLRHSASLAILRAEHEGRTIGFLPLVRVEGRARPDALTVVRSFEIPDAQHTSLLCRAEDAARVSAAFVDELCRGRRERDLLQLCKLRSSPANDALVAQILRESRVTSRGEDDCLCLRLDDTWANYYARRSRRLKKGNNLIANHLKKGFESVAVVRTPIDDSERGGQMVAELARLAAASWKKDLHSALHREGPRSWLESLRAGFGGSGTLVVWQLLLDGQLAAAELQLDYGGTVSALRADVREDFATCSPGTFLNWKVLEASFGCGATVYNMGPGLNEYKLRWAEFQEDLIALDWYSPTTKGLARWFVDRVFRPVALGLRGRLSRSRVA